MKSVNKMQNDFIVASSTRALPIEVLKQIHAKVRTIYVRFSYARSYEHWRLSSLLVRVYVDNWLINLMSNDYPKLDDVCPWKNLLLSNVQVWTIHK